MKIVSNDTFYCFLIDDFCQIILNFINMKKMFLLVGGIVVMSLMSFAMSKDEEVVKINGNVVTIKDTRKISEKDLKFLSTNIVGWTFCKQTSESNNCNTMNRTFPDEKSAKIEVEKVLAKYQ
jgi:hypothetical protein